MNENIKVFSGLSIKSTILLLIIPLLSAIILFGSATLIMLNFPELKNYAITIISLVLFIQALLWLFFVNFAKNKNNLTWKDLWFKTINSRQFHLLWQIPLMFFCLIISQVIIFNLFWWENIVKNDASGVAWLQKNWWLFIWIILFISASFLIPLFEEILFRGFLYNKLKEIRWIYIAAFISALAFMLFHVAPFLFLYMFVLGLYLAWLFEFHKNIWAPIIAHMTLNTTVTLIIILR